MFTGIVEMMGRIADTQRSEGGMRLEVEAPGIELGVGDSIAVNGVCLTSVQSEEGRFAADMVLETLSLTNLGDVGVGSFVNLERPMPADGRFDGHIVQGHVDGVGTVLALEPEGDGKRIRIEMPDDLARYVAHKGSIAVDGVSLTVAGVEGTMFEIALIPHTLAVTTLGRCLPGDRLNLEVDVIAKYVERMMIGSDT